MSEHLVATQDVPRDLLNTPMRGILSYRSQTRMASGDLSYISWRTNRDLSSEDQEGVLWPLIHIEWLVLVTSTREVFVTSHRVVGLSYLSYPLWMAQNNLQKLPRHLKTSGSLSQRLLTHASQDIKLLLTYIRRASSDPSHPSPRA